MVGKIVQGLFSFDGRFDRKTWWGCQALILLLLGLSLGPLLGVSPAEGEEAGPLFAVAVLWMIVTILPTIWIGYAVSAKRFHDLGRSGWWVLLHFIPWIGGFIILVWLGIFPGDSFRNEYGPVPGSPVEDERGSLEEILQGRHHNG